MIKQALISVSNKTGVVDLARALSQRGIKIISSGGTAKLLQENAIPVIEVSDYTGFPEMLDGRVKTLHPKIHAGILSRMDLDAHRQAIQQVGIDPIELVVVNLYPFVETINRADCTLEQAIENIDIGGPTLIRAAAKNYRHVTVITEPEDYSILLAELDKESGTVSDSRRFYFAQKAFTHTARYDSAISNYLTAIDSNGQHTAFPEHLNLNFSRVQLMRYGENPHQQAVFYRDMKSLMGNVANYTQLQGKELSFNNIADTDTAWECVKSFDRPACVIVKHANPCGVAVADNLLAAYQSAFATDPTSAFGGIIAFNQRVDATLASEVIKQFVEVIIAPAFDEAAQVVLKQKTNIRVLTVPIQAESNRYDFKRVGGGLLVQTPDDFQIEEVNLNVVTQLKPTPEQIQDCLFAWRVVKFVKSNAIVFCAQGRTLGIGAGQMSRVDSARIASFKAEQAGLDLNGSTVASDAFFPFRDGLDVVVKAGAKIVIQPGGSIRDNEVIQAADEQGVIMLFTGIRHFRH